jgi:hypothetical protein
MSRTFTLLGYLVFSCSLATAQFVNGVSTTGPAPWIDITAYGAKADSVQPTTTCSLSTVPPGKNLTCTGVSFLPTDVGKVISVYGGAVGGADLFTTIISLVGAAPTTTVVLFVAGVSGASNLTIRYSTDNTFPIQSAINAAKATGSTIYFPYAGTGNYYLFGNPTGTPAVGLTITPALLAKPIRRD